ncbi:MAG: cyclic nucleotide-binding domain-containing protein [Desulfobacterales bacterium]|nr:cyclic nucleotide-binding domain-containing protein [Desulfobacterales bacterium]
MSENNLLSGNLHFIEFAELLQFLGTKAATGILTLTSSYVEYPGKIYFKSGNPIHAENGHVKGMEALLSFFGWTKGNFEFFVENVDLENTIKRNRMQIALEGTKLLDDGLIKKIGPVTFQEEKKSKTRSTIPIVKGPIVDYGYVADEEEYSDGMEIVQQGKHGKWLWVILEGNVKIVKQTPKGEVVILNLGTGSFIGSLSSFLMEGTVRSATAVAIDNVQLGVLDFQRLSKEFISVSQEFRELLINLDKRLKKVTTTTVEIFIEEYNLMQKVKGMKPIIKQSESDEKLYIITKGEAIIIKDIDGKLKVPLMTLGENDYIGHIPFIDMGLEPHYAAVYGSKDIELKEVNINSFKEDFDNLSSTFKNLIESTGTYISVTSMLACDYQKRSVLKKSGVFFKVHS